MVFGAFAEEINLLGKTKLNNNLGKKQRRLQYPEDYNCVCLRNYMQVTVLFLSASSYKLFFDRALISHKKPL